MKSKSQRMRDWTMAEEKKIIREVKEINWVLSCFVLVLHQSHNKSPLTWWLRTTAFYQFVMPKVRTPAQHWWFLGSESQRLKSRGKGDCFQVQFCLEDGVRKNLFIPHSCCWQHPLTCDWGLCLCAASQEEALPCI